MAIRTTRDWFSSVNTRAEFLIVHDAIAIDPMNRHFRSSEENQNLIPLIDNKELVLNPAVPLVEMTNKNGNRYRLDSDENSEPNLADTNPNTQRTPGTRKTTSQSKDGLERAGVAPIERDGSESFINSLMLSGGLALLDQQAVAKRQLEAELAFLSNQDLLALHETPLRMLPEFQLADLLLRKRLEEELKELPGDERENEIQIKLTIAGYERQAEPRADVSSDDDGFEDYLNMLMRKTGDRDTAGGMEEEYDEGLEYEGAAGYYEDEERIGESNGERRQDDKIKVEEPLKNEQSIAVEPEDDRKGGHGNDPIKIEADLAGTADVSALGPGNLDTSQINARIESILPQVQMSDVPLDLGPGQQIEEATIKEEYHITQEAEDDIDVKTE
ncbi:hypothetical protein TWF718_009825 [Orbilia javanica]|uniref:Uncharacterized protein n=1 Tax=Orbilia javanica TaxID=47235 RepID=A0AAN8MKR8_9PEZI